MQRKDYLLGCVVVLISISMGLVFAGDVIVQEGTIDAEKTQPRGRQAVQMRVRVRHQFVRLLGGRIDGKRVIDIVMHRKRHGLVGPIHR